MEDTPLLKLAKQYFILDGTRKANIDDTRKWEEEPQEAAAFWKDNIETFSADEQKQVKDFLPSINAP